MVAKLVTKIGSTVWAQGVLYKAFVQKVLLYGINIWVVTGDILKLLEGFHNR